MIWAVVLAAGASTRMGDAGPKALLRTRDGDTFVERITTTAWAAACHGVLVVVAPPHADQIAAALPPRVSVAHNPMPARGMLSSMQCAIRALPPSAIGALIWPVDIAWVTASTIRAILAVRDQIVIPQVRQDGRPRGGHPVLIPRARFAELLALDPALGLRALIQADPTSVHRLDTEDAAIVVDVDTPEDLARAR